MSRDILRLRKKYSFICDRKKQTFSESTEGILTSIGIYRLIEAVRTNGLKPMKYIQFIVSDMHGITFFLN